MAHEINLVPDIKDEAIKALKLRNLIFFICFVVAVASAGVALVAGMIAGGQSIALSGKENTLNLLSSKVDSYSDLNEFLTIKNQVDKIYTASEKRTALSRTFNIVSAMLPTGADTIKLSKLEIDLTSTSPVMSIEAQADAGKSPFIDYNVLETFKKSLDYVKYDYGTYVDKYGEEIPSYCIIETDDDGAHFYDETKTYMYAYWTIDRDGCNPSPTMGTAAEENENEQNNNEQNEDGGEGAEGDDAEEVTGKYNDYEYEKYKEEFVVRIWRTPRLTEWYKENKANLNGDIYNVQHFESACISYTGTVKNLNDLTWTESNDSCLIVPDGVNGIVIEESSNGRDSDEKLVLTFKAKITISPEVYSFQNTHMLAIAPTGQHIATDSYRQLQDMFTEAAKKCKDNDQDCEEVEEE